jgi:S1-C subfamily serine protease
MTRFTSPSIRNAAVAVAAGAALLLAAAPALPVHAATGAALDGLPAATAGRPLPASLSAFGVDPDLVATAPPLKALNAVAVPGGREERPRGAREVALFRQWSSAVVLVAVNDGLGSGAVIDKARGLIVTNRHVVGDNDAVTILFKPQGALEASAAQGVRAEVLRVDELTDLALLKVANVPAYVPEFKLGSLTGLEVGADVAAIGHPTGEAWSFTQGIVSQIRHNYEWDAGEGMQHRATVIQTQTPINPGNSGGPLIDSNGAIVGINSFVRRDAEGLNYAVSVDDIRTLLTASGSRRLQAGMGGKGPGKGPGKGAAPDGKGLPDKRGDGPGGKDGACQPRQSPVDRDNDGRVEGMLVDQDCDGDDDVYVEDSNGDGKADTVIGDSNGDGKVDYRAIDKDGDGKIDLVYVDKDGDGEADVIGTDTDGDGEPDNWRSFKG